MPETPIRAGESVRKPYPDQRVAELPRRLVGTTQPREVGDEHMASEHRCVGEEPQPGRKGLLGDLVGLRVPRAAASRT